MSNDLKQFLELISKNEELKAKALSYNELEKEDGIKALIDLAAENGITLSEADFEQKEVSCEISDDELDAVVGGSGGCGCVGAGGGGGTDANNGKTYGCACVWYGQGGDGRAEDINCLCIAGGGGSDDWE